MTDGEQADTPNSILIFQDLTPIFFAREQKLTKDTFEDEKSKLEKEIQVKKSRRKVS